MSDETQKLKDDLKRAYDEAVASLPIPEGADTETYTRIYIQMALMDNAIKWRLGDLITQAKPVLGKMAAYRAAAGALRKSVRWALELSKVAETFSATERRLDIDWSVYRAATNTDDPKRFMRAAIEGNLGPREIRLLAQRPQARDLASKG